MLAHLERSSKVLRKSHERRSYIGQDRSECVFHFRDVAQVLEVLLSHGFLLGAYELLENVTERERLLLAVDVFVERLSEIGTRFEQTIEFAFDHFVFRLGNLNRASCRSRERSDQRCRTKGANDN